MSTPNYQRLAATTWKPGHHCRRSGQYVEIDRAGQVVGKEITMVRGKVFPATSQPGGMYRLVDATKHAGDVSDHDEELSND
jgi:hypothetical protein